MTGNGKEEGEEEEGEETDFVGTSRFLPGGSSSSINI
jgi:hypothetical protein